MQVTLDDLLRQKKKRMPRRELGKLMHDFSCTAADEMYYSELADKVRYFKEDEKGLNAMCKVIEDMRNETAENVTVFYIKKLCQK